MTYNIECRICGISIPCIFDDETEITVPRAPSVKNSEGGGVQQKLSLENQDSGLPDTVLIYLTCPNFHGPYPYEIKASQQQEQSQERGGAQMPVAPPPIPIPPDPTKTKDAGSDNPASKILAIADDVYWLKNARDSIDAAHKACDDAAQVLLKIIAWIWPIYTAAFAAGSIYFSKKMDTPTRILLALPILLIFLAYWFAQYALLPVFTKFDPRIPYEIRKEYNYVMNKKKCRLNWAMIYCLLAVLSLSIGLFIIRVDGLGAGNAPANSTAPGQPKKTTLI